MSKINSYCILLTASIKVDNVPFLVVSEATAREPEYYSTLIKWLEFENLPIVFCENTGSDLSKFRQLADNSGGRLEILQYEGNKNSIQYGKGYGELELIEYAVNNSSIIKKSNYVIKVTGRTFVINFRKFEDWLNQSKYAYVNTELIQNFRFAESRMFGFQPAFITDYLTRYKNTINDIAGIFLEHAIAKAIHESAADGNKWEPFPCMPRFEGTHATEGTKLKKTFIGYLLRDIRHWMYNYLLARRPDNSI